MDDRFPYRTEVTVRCPGCGESAPCDPTTAFAAEAQRVVEYAEKNGTMPRERRPLLRCAKCGKGLSVKLLHNTVVHEVRGMLRRYYSHEYGLTTNFGGVNANTIKPAYRESHVRQQCVYLKSRFGERELSQELDAVLSKQSKEGRTALVKALSAGGKDLLKEFRRWLETNLTDANGEAWIGTDQSPISRLGLYTKNLCGSAERNHVNTAALFGCLAARRTPVVASPVRTPAPLTMTA